MSDVQIAYVATFVFGALVGLSEVLSRYRDAPGEAARSLPGILYIGFNGTTSLLAFYFIRQILPLWTDADAAVVASGLPSSHAGDLARDALLAGLGAMAILRSSVLTARVGSKDVEVGPAAVMEIFRLAMDRQIARKRAVVRAMAIAGAMEHVSFRACYQALTGIALSLLQSASADEKAEVERSVAALASQTGRSDRDKALELGLILADSVGFAALASSVRAIQARSDHLTDDRPTFVASQVRRLPPEVVLRELATVCLAANENVRSDQQDILAKEIDAIAKSALSDRAKSISVGLLIAAVLGDESLRIGVELLAPDPPPPLPALPTPAAPPPGEADGDGLMSDPSAGGR